MSKFAQFDQLLLSAIDKGARTFGELVPKLKENAKPLAPPGSDYDRVVDRRLQALRKRGEVEFYRGAWYLIGTAKR